MAQVLIVIGSKSDMEYAEACKEKLKDYKIDGHIEVSSAHRDPKNTDILASTAKNKGFEVIIAMAGMAAALPGVVAARTKLPVIGVPIPATLMGIDALLAIAQMPPGVPVGTMGIGKPGAKNAAILAARILGIKHKEIAERLG